MSYFEIISSKKILINPDFSLYLYFSRAHVARGLRYSTACPRILVMCVNLQYLCPKQPQQGRSDFSS